MVSANLNAKLTKQHFCCKVYRAYLAYLRANHPEVDLPKLCEDAGLPLSYIGDESNWVSVIFDEAFTRLAISRSGNSDLCFRVGAYAMTKPALGTMFHLIVNKFLPVMFIYKQLPRLTSLFSKVTRIDFLEIRQGLLRFDFRAITDGLDGAELGALEKNFENIFQNTMGYYCTAPVERGLPQAQIKVDFDSTASSKLSRRIYLEFQKASISSKGWGPFIPIALTLVLGVWAPFSNLELAGAVAMLWLGFVILYFREVRGKFDQAIQTIQQLDQRYSELHASKEEIRKLSESYSRFVPWQVLNLLGLKSATQLELGMNITRVFTVMFLDIRGFSNLAEKLSPQDTMTFINDFFNRLAPSIRKYQGFVDKYTGDGLMAIFPNRPDDAMDAALEIRKELAHLNEARSKSNLEPLKIGIGINTGKVILGLVGYEHQLQATALSDVVNIASRLEAHTKKMSSDILLGALSYELLESKAEYDCQCLGEITLPGKDRPITAFKLEGLKISEVGGRWEPLPTRTSDLESSNTKESNITNISKKKD